jgi:lipopolysaccharide export system permease protein
LRRLPRSTPRRPRGTLYRYLFRELTFPTLAALAGLTVVILTKDLLGYSELVINRGLGVGAVLMMAFYQSLPLVGTMLPFAVLVGTLVGLGRMGADLELLVLEACGISGRRLVAPVTSFAVLFAGVGFGISLFGGPWASRALDAALERSAMENPGAQVRSGTVNRFGDWKLEALEVNPRGDRMEGVLLWMPEVGETVFAESGALDPDPELGGVRITLRNATVVLDPREQPRLLHFDVLSAHLPKTDAPARGAVDRLAGARLAELARLREEGDTLLARRAGIELQRRFALPFATVIFGFLAVPLFMSRSQFSRAGGGVLGIVTMVAYFGLVQVGDALIQRGTLSIALGAWLPNFVVMALGAALFARLASKSAFGREGDRPQSRPSRRVRRDEAEGRIRVRPYALQRYVAGRFLQMAVLCFAVCLVAYLLVDVLERLKWFFRYGATLEEILHFYLARVPLLASRVVPMSLLVATSLTVSLIAAQGELLGMRASGIPAPRALLPVLGLCAAITPLYFLLNNEVVPRTNALADRIKTTEIKDQSGRSGRSDAVWYRSGDLIYEVSLLDMARGRAEDVVIYEVTPDGQPLSRLDARSATHIESGIWRLEDAVRFELTDEGLQETPPERVARLGDQMPADRDTMHMSIGELMKDIEEVEANGHEATTYIVDLHVKLAMPLACILLPGLALLFAVTGPPFPSSAVTLILSVAVAVAYTLFTGVGSSLGYGGALPPVLAGWASTGFFAAVVAGLALRLRGFGQRF